MDRNVRIGAARLSWMLACLSLLLVGMLSLQSCKKEYFDPTLIKDPTWNPELAVPLIKSTVTVPEVLGRFDDQDVIVIDTTGILALRYFGNIFTVSAENVVLIQNQSNTQNFPLLPADATTLALGGQVNVGPVTYNMPLDMSNLASVPQLHSITFKGGTLDINLATDFSWATNLTLAFPDLSGTNSITVSNGQSGSINLAGHTLDLTQGGLGYNQIRVTVSGTINGGSGTGLPTDQMHITAAINNPAFSLLLGDIKQQTFGTPASEVRIRFFENQQDGTIHWNDPRVKAIFNSRVGADVGLTVGQMDFASPSSTQALNSTQLNTLVIGHNATVGGNFPTTVDINRTNSNVVNVAAIGPTKLFYQVDATTNPGGGSNVNWLQDTSKISLDMEVFLPFDGTAVDFAKSDTTLVEIFPIQGDIQEIESVTFRLTIDNGFPADAHAQVYFFDSTLVDPNFVGTPIAIDSMFPNGRAVVFGSPTPGAGGRVDQTQKKRTTLDITLNRELLNKLEANKFTQLVARGWVDTYQLGAQNVQIFSDYTMDLYLGVIVKIKYKVKI